MVFAAFDPSQAPIVMVMLRDASGQTLLRLDQEMQPATGMRRFLDRAGRAIAARKATA